jgi:hypothetical protein
MDPQPERRVERLKGEAAERKTIASQGADPRVA